MKPSLFQFTIGKRISLGFALVILVTIGLGVFAFQQLGTINTASKSVTEDALPSVQTMLQIQVALKEYKMAVLNHIIASTPEQKAEYERAFQAVRDKITNLYKEFEKTIFTEQARELFNKTQELRPAVLQHCLKALELDRDNKTQEAKDEYAKGVESSYAPYEAAVAKLTEFKQNRAESESKSIQEVVLHARTGVEICLAIVIGIGIVIAFFVVRSITGPLSRALNLVHRVSDKDLTASVENASADEVGQMCRSLNDMVSSLSGNMQTIGDTSQSVAAASEELDAVSSQVSATSEEASRQANAVAAAAEQVSSNISTVATAAEEMGGTIKEIAKNASEAARIASQAVRAAEETNASVSKLGDSTLEIGNVVKVITSIAEQTNLLALNATIEAARAGEAGKGFAVVANEVKELAKQTAAATEDISKKIAAIQGDSKGAVDAIQKIGAIIDQINEMQTTIASAVEEQTAATNEIARNAAEAARGSGEITRSVAGVSEAVRTTTQAAGQTLTAAQELAQLAASLESVVKEFKIESSGARGETSRPQAGKAAKPVKAPVSSSRNGVGRALPQSTTPANGGADPFVHGNAAHPRS